MSLLCFTVTQIHSKVGVSVEKRKGNSIDVVTYKRNKKRTNFSK